MASWEKILARGNVDDRRSNAPVVAGGVGIAGVVLYLLVNLLSDGQVTIPLDQLAPLEQQGNVNTQEYEGMDEYEVFASTVLGSNNNMWKEKFSSENRSYREPKLVLFRTATESACGVATSEVGPHYCSVDETIYLDETFFDELVFRFGAEGGDVAEAYVISHEVAHHAQNLLGRMDTVSSNDDSINLELQADCYAGLWSNSIKELDVLTPGEIAEAMDAAASVGDDRIQEKVTGYVNPESWTHGSSDQRVAWFTTGYETGSLSACNTFD